MERYDLIVIGCGPGGEKAAAKAAYFGHKVAIIESQKSLGGEATASAIPSKALKETALYFSGKMEKGLYGAIKEIPMPQSMTQFLYRTNQAILAEAVEIENNIFIHKIKLYRGVGSFIDPHTIEIISEEGQSEQIQGDYIIIATGAYPLHPDYIPFGHPRIYDYQTLISIKDKPRSVCIAGAGVIGCEYATFMSTMGVKIFLTNPQPDILPVLDREIVKLLVDIMEKDNITLHLQDSVSSITIPEKNEDPLTIHFSSGKDLQVDVFVFAAGRSGNTKSLQCERAGVNIGKRELIEVNEKYQTNIPHIYAIGDVIGFPSLASTSMDQGRVAISHIFNTKDFDTLSKIIPYGIYTIPEIAMVGITEEEATKQNISFCVGRARYKDVTRGKILGIEEGILKIIFRRDNLEVIGVHIIGSIATELIHFGVALIENKKTVLEVISMVFNYPTFHDLYKYASYDGLGNLSGHKIKK